MQVKIQTQTEPHLGFGGNLHLLLQQSVRLAPSKIRTRTRPTTGLRTQTLTSSATNTSHNPRLSSYILIAQIQIRSNSSLAMVVFQTIATPAPRRIEASQSFYTRCMHCLQILSSEDKVSSTGKIGEKRILEVNNGGAFVRLFVRLFVGYDDFVL